MSDDLRRGEGGTVLPAEIYVRLTDQTLSCTARGPRAEARAARGALHVRRANARRVTP